MRRFMSSFLSFLIATLLTGTAAQAQAVTQNPQQQPNLEAERLRFGRFVEGQVPGQRAGRGQGDGGAAANDALNRYRLAVVNPQTAGAWWTNANLVARLGLTDDQKLKIERAFDNHRLNIVTATRTLEREEAQLASLLSAETIDKNAILLEIDRVVQARGDVERANSSMTLEMREYLTREQWMQLPRTTTLSIGTSYLAPGIGGRALGERSTAPAATPEQTQPQTVPGQRRGGRGGRGPQ